MSAKQLIKDFVKVDLTKNQVSALESFINSMGEDVFKNSTLLKVLNRNELSTVPLELSKWVVQSGKRSAELVQLREQEIQLFSQ
jgi:lysozyme